MICQLANALSPKSCAPPRFATTFSPAEYNLRKREDACRRFCYTMRKHGVKGAPGVAGAILSAHPAIQQRRAAVTGLEALRSWSRSSRAALVSESVLEFETTGARLDAGALVVICAPCV